MGFINAFSEELEKAAIMEEIFKAKDLLDDAAKKVHGKVREEVARRLGIPTEAAVQSASSTVKSNVRSVGSSARKARTRKASSTRKAPRTVSTGAPPATSETPTVAESAPTTNALRNALIAGGVGLGSAGLSAAGLGTGLYFGLRSKKDRRHGVR